MVKLLLSALLFLFRTACPLLAGIYRKDKQHAIKISAELHSGKAQLHVWNHGEEKHVRAMFSGEVLDSFGIKLHGEKRETVFKVLSENSIQEQTESMAVWSRVERTKTSDGKPVGVEGRAWNNCMLWNETTPGLNDDFCQRDMTANGFIGAKWKHVYREKSSCPDGSGKGICVPDEIPKHTLDYHEKTAHDLLATSKQHLSAANDSIIDSILRLRTKELKDVFEKLRGTVNILSMPGGGTEQQLNKCTFWRKIDFFLHQHSAEVWIPFVLRYHPVTSQLASNSTGCISQFCFNYVHSLLYSFVLCHGDSMYHERWDLMFQQTRRMIEIILSTEAWNASAGFDFIVPASHPFVPLAQITGNFEESFVSHSSFLSVDYDGRATYPKDIIIPYFVTVRNSSSAPAKRKRLLMLCTYPVQIVRQRILKAFSNISADVFVAPRYVQPSLYDELLRTTTFCFVVRGDSTSSSRFFDALASGCIPIVVSDWIYLPFQNLIDYSRFCIFVRDSEVMANPHKFLQSLRGVSASKVQEMQEYLFQARFLLDYSSAHLFNPVTLLFVESFLRRICYRKFLTERSQEEERLCLTFNAQL